MKVKSFSTTSSLFPQIELSDDKPICAVVGSSVYLHLLYELLAGEDADPIDPEKSVTFRSRVSIELDGKSFELCGVLCDDQSFFMAVDSGGSDRMTVIAETMDCQRRLKMRNIGAQNLLSCENPIVKNERCLSESDYRLENLHFFLERLRADSARNDDRPIFLFQILDRIDEAVDITPLLDALASLGRQVFLSVGARYPMEKLRHKSVQTVRLSL